jgi:hypothetical protein
LPVALGNEVPEQVPSENERERVTHIRHPSPTTARRSSGFPLRYGLAES